MRFLLMFEKLDKKNHKILQLQAGGVETAKRKRCSLVEIISIFVVILNKKINKILQ